MKETKENVRRSKQFHSRVSNRAPAEHKATLASTDSRIDVTMLGAECSPLEVHF
jgi:hypothetical protein